ncbi:MAG: hypothetical protein JWO54_167 [Candidatus Saccharibacteria bacterium]|nr:hypothetical protein [Candidatus Saccharibacteria bacterium]MDB5180409.1 hypothetical protein [Candidatus Saccharibacteria bacterium]
MSRKNIIRIIVVVFLLLIVGLITYSLIPRATLIMSVAPEEFNVTINGHDNKVKTGDAITVTPGDVTFKLSREGFEDYTQTITIKNGQRIEILQALVAQTDEARELLKTEKSQAIIQRVTNVNMLKAANSLSKKYPLLDELPIVDKFYAINVCESKIHPDDISKVAICITLYEPEAKQSAIDDVTSRGFNLDDYETYFEAPVEETNFDEPYGE